ncbi:MAG: beta strand repeat-containing protein, partial [Cyanobium sp.]
QATSFNINLATNNLTVNGIPGIGSASFFVQNFTDVRGTSNADIVVGDGARNGFFGTAGDDSYNGLGGFDTIDYSALGTAVTLKSQGIIEKGALGTDTIAGMERIIGATGQINVIDGFTGGPQPTSFEIDLDGGLLLVKDIPFIGDQAFFIRNFVNVRGTSNDDVITGSSVPGTQGDNTFFGSSGNDSYDGAGGIDTIDYSSLGQQVTLKSQGVIVKDGGFGTDTIAGVERIIGSLGQFNVIDGSVAGPQSTSFNINLATNNLTVNGIPGIGSASFFIENFIDVRGTSNDDTIVGNANANSFFGGGGNDSLTGGAGDDSYGFDTDLALGSDTLDETGGGVDTLNFSDTTTRSVAVNLGLAASQVVNAGLSLTLGSASTVENVIGGALADTLTGNGLANNLNGGAGNDTLIGGAGADRFRFASTLNAITNRDVISDFSIAQLDRIELENDVFTALTTTGTLAASAFFIGAAATTATQRILYNSGTGNLLYDLDGTGAGGSVAFATLATGLALDNTFFTIT